MPIKFDTLEELKAFYTAFKLSGKSVDELEAPKKSPKKRGRKPKATQSATPKKRGRKSKKATAVTASTPKKRGRPAKKVTGAKAKSTVRKVGRPAGSKTKTVKAKKSGRKVGRPSKKAS